MTDVHDKKTRSYNMSMIRSKDTKPEIIVRKFLFGNGFRYKLYDKTLPGKPDLVFPKYKTVIFIHGCFWHGHEGCKYFVVPKTRTKWWLDKINSNIANDKKKKTSLKNWAGKPLLYRNVKLKPEKRGKTLSKLLKQLKKSAK